MDKIVLIKSFPNEPLKRFLVKEQNDGVQLCLKEDFDIWQNQGEPPFTTKCPYSRVFNFDDELYEKLKEAAYSLENQNLLESLWEQAIPYTDNQNPAKKVIADVA